VGEVLLSNHFEAVAKPFRVDKDESTKIPEKAFPEMFQELSRAGRTFETYSCIFIKRRFGCPSSARGDFRYEPILQTKHFGPETKWKLITKEGIRVTKGADGEEFLSVDRSVLTTLSRAAMADINFLFRSKHLEQLRQITLDGEASSNDKFVALELLKNASIASSRVLPSCQDTGTATVVGFRGERVLTGGLLVDEEAISRGVYEAYHFNNFRYSQVAPLSMFQEQNTRTNLPAQIDLMVGKEAMEYELLYIAKGGGSANKAQLFQKTKALLRDQDLEEFLTATMASLGTAACPPYHLAVVIGGTSAEMTMKTMKLLSCKFLDNLPTSGNEYGRAFRDLVWEKRLQQKARELGVGAQFGGKYFVHDVRVVRLPRHGASLPVAIGVSCSADRQAIGRITREGAFLEQLEEDPGHFLPPPSVVGQIMGSEDCATSPVVKIDTRNLPMSAIVENLGKYPVSTRVAITGTLVVARDIAHSRIADALREGKKLPEYLTKFPIYYAGPAKKPQGAASGSFGPTTAGRMDPYVPGLQAIGASLVMIGKGNRGKEVRESCKKNNGFYLGSIGGAAAILAQQSIKKVEVLDMTELGMEAVWKIEVEDFPAFIVIDNKGNDFYSPPSPADAAAAKATHDQLGN
jgi:fumarate hydratase class I